MTGPAQIVRRYPMTSFAVLACVLGWSIFIAAALGAGGAPDNMPLGPLVAALVVVACQGRGELRAWGRRLRSWRVAPRWYALAVAVPVVVHVTNVLVNHLAGAPLPTAAQLSHWPDVPVAFVVMLVMVGIGEEAGWTAFAAPLLLRRHGMLGAWAVLSCVRILWHLPLMLNGEMPWVMGIVGNAAFQALLLQLVTAAGGRWSVAAVWHATLNAFGGAFFFTMVSGRDLYHLDLLLTGVYALLAVVVALTRPSQVTAAAASSRRTRATGIAAVRR
jgi:membrane protease YdiL (CAAX protease family)